MDLLAAYASDDADDEQGPSKDATQDPQPPLKRPRPSERRPQGPAIPLPSAAALLDASCSIASLQDLCPTRPLSTHAAPPCNRATQRSAAAAASSAPPARVRTFPHVEGDFPTVVYISVPEALSGRLHHLTALLLAQCPAATASSSGPAGMAAGTAAGAAPAQQAVAGLQLWPTHPQDSAAAGTTHQLAGDHHPSSSADSQQQQQQQRPQQLPLHVSVSRTVPIRRVQIESLKVALAKQLKPLKACRVTLQGLVALVNETRTRSFVGVRVAAGEKQVARLIEAVDRAFTLHGLQTFHEVPLPHVSLAWAPGDQAARLQPWLDSLQLEPLVMQVSQVVVQIGMLKHVVWQA